MLRVRVTWTAPQGGPYLSTHYFQGDDTQAGATAANAAVKTFWDGIRSRISNSYSFTTQAEVAQLSNTGTLEALYAVTPLGNPGLNANSRLPDAAQALIRWNTNVFFGGRRLKGKTFVPGLTTEDLLAGGLTTTAQSQIDIAAEALIADATTVLSVWARGIATVASVAGANVWAEFAMLTSRRD